METESPKDTIVSDYIKPILPEKNLNKEKILTHKKSIYKNPIFYILTFLILIIAGFSCFFIIKNSTGNNLPTYSNNNHPVIPSTTVNTTTTANTTTPTIVTTTSLPKPNYIPLPDLKLIIQDDVNKIPINGIDYYQIGTFSDPKYSGYKRIISINQKSNIFSDVPQVTVYATKDDNKYIIQTPYNIQTYTNLKDYLSSHSYNPQKIIGQDNLLSSFPSEIKLDDNLSLYNSFAFLNFDLTQINSGTFDPSGNPFTKLTPVTDFSTATFLNTKDPNLSYYYYNKPQFNSNDIVQRQYLGGDTTVYAIDHDGLSIKYTLVWSNSISSYLTDVNSKSTSPVYPNLNLKSSSILNPTQAFFDNYSRAFPGGCSSTDITTIINSITDSDLIKVGNINDINLFTLKDKNHPLNKLEYSIKIREGSVYYKSFSTTSLPTPSFDTYVAKSPLLFFKDYWGRLISVGEFDYLIGGGCGKPVMYFYPTQDTKINVQIDTAINFDHSIPTYNNGWSIIGKPNGELTDLQPQFTNCNSIPNIFGLEYGRSACHNNLYPYIYWSGRSAVNQMPQSDNGWYVSNQDLSSFFDSTLSTIGLSNKEKQDMTSYWIPKLEQKDAPYYRINFLQTSEMNNFIPLTISPRPNNLYRIFLDWSPLSSKPTSNIIPPGIEKIKRDGFTVIEWGGLER